MGEVPSLLHLSHRYPVIHNLCLFLEQSSVATFAGQGQGGGTVLQFVLRLFRGRTSSAVLSVLSLPQLACRGGAPARASAQCLLSWPKPAFVSTLTKIAGLCI